MSAPRLIPRPPALTLKQAALALRRHHSTTSSDLRSGRLIGRKIGPRRKYWRIPAAAVEGFSHPRRVMYGYKAYERGPLEDGHTHVVETVDAHGDDHCRCGASRFRSAISGWVSPWGRFTLPGEE